MNMQLYRMVEAIKERFDISKNVEESMLNTPRDLFIPSGMSHIAYQLDALPLLAKQFISSPLTVAKMTEYLNINNKCDNVLEIGLGSGYQAVILSKIFRRVFSIERVERLMEEARIRIKKLGIMNINIKFADGLNGWSQFAPYDRILFSSSVNMIPDRIIDQLSDGGILVAPMIYDNGTQVITRFIKLSSKLNLVDKLDQCSFVPTISGIE